MIMRCEHSGCHCKAENLAMAEHLDLMMHYKAENLLLSLPRKLAAGIHPSSCATVAVWEIQVPEYAINDCLQKVRLLVGSVELEGEVLPANHLEPRLASLPRFRSLLASPPTTSARTAVAVVAPIRVDEGYAWQAALPPATPRSWRRPR